MEEKEDNRDGEGRREFLLIIARLGKLASFTLVDAQW